MANRYWVGGTAAWDGTAGTKWATTSGGTGGASVPTSSDNVFFDANSGSGTVTVASNVNMLDLDCSGFAGTLSVSATLNVYGSFTLSSGMTLSGSSKNVTFRATSTGKTITLAGKTLSTVGFNGAGGGWTLNDAFSCSGNLTFTAGTLSTNDQAVSTKDFSSTGAAARTLNLGSTVWSMVGSGQWNCGGATNFTFNCGTSTIRLGDSPGTTAQAFSGNGFTYHNVEITGSGSNTVTVYGSNTFNSFSVNKTAAFTLSIEEGTTQTVSTWVGGGTAGNTMTLSSRIGSPGSALTKSTGGAATITYAAISWISASPGSTWYATNSTDGGNNSGITFGAPPTQSNGLFFGSNF